MSAAKPPSPTPKRRVTVDGSADDRREQRTLGVVLRAATGPVPTMTAAWLAAFVLSAIQSPAYAVLIGLGFIGAFVAGLVGIGGAVLMIPLLLYVPPLFGVPALAIHTVSGLTMVQVPAAGLAGLLGHLHRGSLDGRLVLVLGGGMAAGSLVGALLSGVMPPQVLAGTFAALALVAAVLMFLPRKSLPDAAASATALNVPIAVGSGFVVGLIVGTVGAGGGFVLVPVMALVLRVPLRSAVSASLAIVALSGLMGMVGKGVTGQIDWLMALALVTGALPGARLGAVVSRGMAVTALSFVLGVVITLAAVRIGWDILLGR